MNPREALNSVGTLINSPPGQLAVGVVLAGATWMVFERVEGNEKRIRIRSHTLYHS